MVEGDPYQDPTDGGSIHCKLTAKHHSCIPQAWSDATAHNVTTQLLRSKARAATTIRLRRWNTLSAMCTALHDDAPS